MRKCFQRQHGDGKDERMGIFKDLGRCKRQRKGLRGLCRERQ